jgi:hypothetical protein
MVGKLTVSGLPGVRSELAFMRGEMSVAPTGSCVAFALMAALAPISTQHIRPWLEADL